MMGALLPTSFKPLCLVTKNAWNHLLSFQNPVSSFLNLFLQMRVLYRSPPLEAGSKCFYHGWLSFVLIMYGSEWWSWCCRLRRRGYCVNCEEVSEVGWKIRRVLFHTHGCLQAHSEKSWKNRCSSVITMLCDMKLGVYLWLSESPCSRDADISPSGWNISWKLLMVMKEVLVLRLATHFLNPKEEAAVLAL